MRGSTGPGSRGFSAAEKIESVERKEIVSLTLYMDVHVPYAVAHGLRQAGIDVLTAQEDGGSDWPDEAPGGTALAPPAAASAS